MNYWDNGHMDNGWGFVMVFGMLGLWVLAAVAIAWIIRVTRPPVAPPAGSGARTPEQILAERLARGEIDPEEYRARLDALSKP